MALKGLRQFVVFDANKFLKGKELLLMNEEDLVDYDSNKVVGAKLKVIIWSDNTSYKKEGTTNEGSELTIKILGIKAQNIDQNNRGFISLKNPKGSVYGDFQNQLSLSADGFEFLKSQNGDK